MQKVNLYQAEFKRGRDKNSVLLIALACVALLIFVGINISQKMAISNLDKQLAKKQSELVTLEKTLEILKQKAKPMAQDMNLSLELDRIRQANASKLRASNYLSGDGAGNTIGFSYLLEGLGRKRDIIEDLWLTKIEIRKGGYEMRLSGKNTHPGLLPQFIQALSGEELYKGREFKKMKINRSEEKSKTMDFILDTRYTGKSSESKTNSAGVMMFMEKLKHYDESQVAER